MFNTTITLFNRYRSANFGDTWYPHVIENVQLIKDNASIREKYGEDSKDNANLIINLKSVNGIHFIKDFIVLPPQQWAEQVNDQLPASLTFNDDSEGFDFFVEGDLGITQPVDDSDYKNGFYNYCNKKYNYCYAITSVGSGYTLIPHVEILAK